MYIETKNGLIYSPVNPANTGLYEWLKTYIVLDGSDAYIEIARLYEMQEYDYECQLADYESAKRMEESA
jgi:hypothetical protein